MELTTRAILTDKLHQEVELFLVNTNLDDKEKEKVRELLVKSYVEGMDHLMSIS